VAGVERPRAADKDVPVGIGNCIGERVINAVRAIEPGPSPGGLSIDRLLEHDRRALRRLFGAALAGLSRDQVAAANGRYRRAAMEVAVPEDGKFPEQVRSFYGRCVLRISKAHQVFGTVVTCDPDVRWPDGRAGISGCRYACQRQQDAGSKDHKECT